MMVPPSILRLLVCRPGRRRINLWIPVFMIWPGLVGLWVALLPVHLLLGAALWRTGAGKWILCGPPRAFAVFCCARGLEMSFENVTERVVVQLV